MSKFEKTYNVEEFHRGKWIPLMVENKDGVESQRRVRITPEQAARNNAYSADYKRRYLLADEVEVKDDALEAAKAEYQEKFGKKPHHSWDVEKINEKINE